MKIRVMNPEERKYTYAQSKEVQEQTGCIGYLRGDFDQLGNGFYTSWFDQQRQWKTKEFRSEMDKVVNALCSDEYAVLQSRTAMADYVRQHSDSGFPGNYCTEYGFRVDTETYSYLLRCNLIKGDYNFYCFCYSKEHLDRHLANMEKEMLVDGFSGAEFHESPEREKTSADLVYICAPLRGNIEKNVEFARQKAKEVFEQGDIPICPHLMFVPIADPEDTEQDRAAREMSLKLLASCQRLHVYGSEWTKGMWTEIHHAHQLGIPVYTDQKEIPKTRLATASNKTRKDTQSR